MYGMEDNWNFKYQVASLKNFLYKILFGLWQLDIKIIRFIWQSAVRVSLVISKIVLTKYKRTKFSKYLNANHEGKEKFLCDPLNGAAISSAARTLQWLTLAYASPIPFIAFGIVVRLSDNINIGFGVFLISLIGIVWLVPSFCEKNIQRDYIAYFDNIIKTPEYKTSRYIWHSILFGIGAILVFILGILSCFLIVTNFQIIDMIINR